LKNHPPHIKTPATNNASLRPHSPRGYFLVASAIDLGERPHPERHVTITAHWPTEIGHHKQHKHHKRDPVPTDVVSNDALKVGMDPEIAVCIEKECTLLSFSCSSSLFFPLL
jgi:hypothetical protein